MNAVPTAVTMFVAVLAVASIAAVLAVVRRSTRLTGMTVGVSAVAAIAIVVGALFVGGSLTQPPAAVADMTPNRSSVDLVDPAVMIELPTLSIED